MNDTPIPSSNYLTYAALPQGPRPSWLGSAEMDQYQSGGAFASGSLGDQLVNGNQTLTSIDPMGYAMRGRAPTGRDRFGRAVMGAINGYDFGNRVANVGADFGAAMVPGGQLVNSGFGAAQGAMSNKPVYRRELPPSSSEGQAPSYGRPDVMPRIYGSGLLDPTAQIGAESYGGGGVATGFAQNPIASRPAVPGQPQATGGGTGSMGGSGRPVDAYGLPAEDDLLALLSNPERYTGYDAGTGRTGMAGRATGAGGYAYGGFDFAQDPANRDIGKSAKYAFSQFAEQAAASGAPQPRTKAEAEQWFVQYIAPGLRAAGYEIDWVKGDKARIRTREGWDEIDFLVNADGPNPTLAWQSEVLAPGGPMAAGGGAQGGGQSLPISGMDLTSSALFQRLMEQANQIAAGRSSGANVMDTQALVDLLGGGR